MAAGSSAPELVTAFLGTHTLVEELYTSSFVDDTNSLITVTTLLCNLRNFDLTLKWEQKGMLAFIWDVSS